MYFAAIASTWCLHVAREELLELLPLDVVLRAEHALEVVERELGVDGDEPVDLDHRVHALAACEPVLQRERRRREPVAQQILEQQLAEAAARLRGAQRLLEALEVVRARQDLLVRAAELAQAALDLARGLRRALEAAVERRGHRLEAPVDLCVALGQLGAGLGPQNGQLRAEPAQEPGGADRESGEREQHEKSDPHGTYKR